MSLMNIRQAAKYLGVTRQTLYNWNKWGYLVFLKHPVYDRNLVSSKDLDKILLLLKDKKTDKI